MSVDVREELAVVHFLTEINREIEIIDRKGKNKILLFQKFPELVNIKEFIVEQFFSDFDGEMILHKMMQYIPQILILVKYYHNFNIESPFLYKITTPKMLWNYRAIIWAISLLLNIVCLRSYTHDSNGDAVSIKT